MSGTEEFQLEYWSGCCTFWVRSVVDPIDETLIRQSAYHYLTSSDTVLLNPVHITYGDVVIEHVDFYGSVHTHCVVVRRRTLHVYFCGMLVCIAFATQLCPLTTTLSSMAYTCTGNLASAVSCVDVRRRTQCERTNQRIR